MGNLLITTDVDDLDDVMSESELATILDAIELTPEGELPVIELPFNKLSNSFHTANTDVTNGTFNILQTVVRETEVNEYMIYAAYFRQKVVSLVNATETPETPTTGIVKAFLIMIKCIKKYFEEIEADPANRNIYTSVASYSFLKKMYPVLTILYKYINFFKTKYAMKETTVFKSSYMIKFDIYLNLVLSALHLPKGYLKPVVQATRNATPVIPGPPGGSSTPAFPFLYGYNLYNDNIFEAAKKIIIEFNMISNNRSFEFTDVTVEAYVKSFISNLMESNIVMNQKNLAVLESNFLPYAIFGRNTAN